MAKGCSPLELYDAWKREEGWERNEYGDFATMDDVDDLRELDWRDKLAFSSAMVQRLWEEHNPVVAWSGGKGSTALLHLALETLDEAPTAIFANTGIQYPGQYEQVERLSDEWEIELIETEPFMAFGKVVAKHGPPSVGRRNYTELKKGTMPCCYELKEGPEREAVDEHGFDATVVGIQGSESYNRRWLAARCGLVYRITSGVWRGIWKGMPIWHWNENDLDRYIEENEIPLPAEYGEMDRTGCKFCTAYKGGLKSVKRKYPKVGKYLEQRRGELQRHEEQTTLIGDRGRRAWDETV